MWGEGRDNGQPRKTKVCHGACNRTNVEGVARGDEDDMNAVGLVLREQAMIVERREKRGLCANSD